VGSNVNIAARVAAEAERHQVLVTAAVRNESKGLPGIEFVPLGKRRLKGLASELVLFEARAAGAKSREQYIDPVCGMEMGPEEVAARLTLEGVERAFCSDECLRRYVASPERYGG
jgi:YHS domain-containing protein